MADLLNLIKIAGKQAVGAENPVNLLFGEVLAVNPLSVIVDQRLRLDAGFLIVPESLTRYELDLKHSHNTGSGSTGEALEEKAVVRAGLQEGDKIILLRMQGGQKYLLLDKVVEI